MASQRTSRNRVLRLVVCALLVAGLMPVAPASAVPTYTDVYVDAALGSDSTGDGSVAAPYKSISHAVGMVGAGAYVHVAPGVYSPTTTGETFPLALPSSAQIVGTAGATTTIVDAEGESGIFALADVSGVLIQGLWLTNGDASGPIPSGGSSVAVALSGGAVDAWASSFRLADSIVTTCAANDGGAVSAYGDEFAPSVVTITGTSFGRCNANEGGALSSSYTSITVSDCDFEDCWATYGGAVDFDDVTALVTGCSFARCGWLPADQVEPAVVRKSGWIVKGRDLSAAEFPPGMSVCEEGGAIRANWSTLQVAGSGFDDNVANVMGGAVSAWDAYLIVGDGSSFTGNFITASSVLPGAAGPGGWAVGAGIYSGGTLDLSDTYFEDNGAPVGGAVYVEPYGSAQIRECGMSANYALSGSSVAYGGSYAPFGRPSASIDTDSIASVLDIDRCWFEGEFLADSVLSFDGSGATKAVFEPLDGPQVHNSVFTGNETLTGATSAFVPVLYSGLTFADNAWMAAIAEDGEDVGSSAQNLIAWGNTVPEVLPPGDVSVQEVPAEPGPPDVVGPITVSNSDLANGFDAIDGGGNISADPLFTDPGSADYSIKFGSPCIDTGAGMMARPWDYDGLERPTDGDYSGTDEFDMGAFEFAGGSPIRIGGADRYETSVDVCQARYATAETVVIATGRQFADGLAASGLCGAYDAPLLLSMPGELPDVVAAEIERLGATEAIIVGGTNAVSQAVEDTLVDDLGLTIERIGGADRYETSFMIALHMADLNPALDMLFVARGDRFADALTAAPSAWSLQVPVVLLPPDEYPVPEAAFDVVTALGSPRIVIVGGEAAVSSRVESAARVVAQSVDRISGADRYETSVNFSEYALDAGWADFETVGIATGLAYPDALCGGPSIGAAGGVLLLTPPDSLHPAVADALEAHAPGHIEVLGGPAAVTPDVFDALMAP